MTGNRLSINARFQNIHFGVGAYIYIDGMIRIAIAKKHGVALDINVVFHLKTEAVKKDGRVHVEKIVFIWLYIKTNTSSTCRPWPHSTQPEVADLEDNSVTLVSQFPV